MSDIFDEARAIINAAQTHPDPEGAMEALEKRASRDEKPMFASLWSALTRKLNEGAPDDPQ